MQPLLKVTKMTKCVEQEQNHPLNSLPTLTAFSAPKAQVMQMSEL